MRPAVLPQDSLLCSEAKGAQRNGEQQRRAEMVFLCSVAAGQTPRRHQDPAQFLLNIARLRVCLSEAARLLQGAAGQGVKPQDKVARDASTRGSETGSDGAWK